MSRASSLRLVVFDWSGTTIDFGSVAPVAAFLTAFRAYDIDVTAAQARGPMGLFKRDHIRCLLELPAIAEQWRARHGRDWTLADVDAIYERFTPVQAAEIERHSELIPETVGCVAALRERGLAIGTTTGYTRALAGPMLAAAQAQGYAPDTSRFPDDVSAGRPAPWMIFSMLEELGVYPPACVIKVGDTTQDIAEGLAAGAWSVGVAGAGNEIGLSLDDWQALPADDRAARLTAARERLAQAGAHAVIDTLADLPALVDAVNERLAAGAAPGRWD